MTHELIHILQNALINQKLGLKSVLASVVHLKGSSYRKPGVKMLICENGNRIGAVSGGCVENEIERRAKSVLETSTPKIIVYDGRYRLGCEGILHILIEPFQVSELLIEKFDLFLKERKPYAIESYYKFGDDMTGEFGSVLICNGEKIRFSENFKFENNAGFEIFSQTLNPQFRLIIIGGEHDAVKLCQMANLLGWEVDVITSLKDPKSLDDFPGAIAVSAIDPSLMELKIDNDTAIMLMTHNYALDLKYLVQLNDQIPKYLGIIGSSKRRERLKNDLIDYTDDTNLEFLENIYSPAGLNIGAINAEEIALSILSEIMSVFREKQVSSLRDFKKKLD